MALSSSVPSYFGDYHLSRSRELASGTFGMVYVVCHKSGGPQLACKVERPGTKATQVHYEYRIYYDILQQPRHLSQYFLSVCDYGTTPEGYKYMVMDLAGDDLTKVSRRLPRHKLVRLTKECLLGIRAFHQMGYLHRDIKPSNFVLSQGDRGRLQVKLIDLGLSKKFVQDQKHIAICRKRTMVGTNRYQSVFTSAYVQSGRRDDILSWIYTSINILGERLPWQQTPPHIDRIRDEKVKKKKKQEHVFLLKRICSPNRVTHNCPRAFSRIYASACCLQFAERPPYERYIEELSLPDSADSAGSAGSTGSAGSAGSAGSS